MENVYIPAGPEFGEKSYGKNLIVEKSLHGLKTSAARFHEHSAKSTDQSFYAVKDHSNWRDFYPEAEEEIRNDLLYPKCPKVRMTVYVGADDAHDLLTRRSITGIFVMFNNTPLRWVSKC